MIGSVLCHLWGHYIIGKFKSLVRVDILSFNPLGPARVILQVPFQEGSRSLATDKITSNHIICSVALT
jgi:hypothetical protein